VTSKIYFSTKILSPLQKLREYIFFVEEMLLGITWRKIKAFGKGIVLEVEYVVKLYTINFILE
jgi:hypothetical protein